MENTRIAFYRKWHGVPLEDWGWVVSPEYRGFQRAFKNLFKKIADDLGGEVVNFIASHYDEDVFIRRGDKYVNILHRNQLFNRSTPWLKSWCIRTAASATDYHGGTNNWVDYVSLVNEIDRLLGGNGKIEDTNKFPHTMWLTY